MTARLQYFLEALGGEHRCLECECIVDQFQMFCMKCGSINLEFNESALKEEFGSSSIEKVRQNECPDYHNVSQLENSIYETAEEILDFIKECPFCPHCGMNVMRIVIH